MKSYMTVKNEFLIMLYLKLKFTSLFSLVALIKTIRNLYWTLLHFGVRFINSIHLFMENISKKHELITIRIRKFV